MARICLIRLACFDIEPRVRREVDALLSAGHEVDVICIRRPGSPRPEAGENLRIHHLPLTRRNKQDGSGPRALRRRGSGWYRLFMEFFVLPLTAGVWLIWLDRRRRFDLVEVNTLPDWLVFAALGARMRGVPVLLDLQEPMPEFFASKFKTAPDHLGVRILKRLERASISFATHAITCTEEMREAFVARGGRRDQIDVVMNSADESVFDPHRHPPRPREDGRFTLVSHGSVEERYGLDTTVRAVGRLRDRIPNLTLEIYGGGSYLEELRELVDALGLAQCVRFHGYVQIDELVAAIADADAGVVAMKPDAFRHLTQCNKMFDLITMQRPVICSRTLSVQRHFPDGALKYFEGGDDADLVRAIEELYAQPELCARLVNQATETNQPYRWEHQRTRYLAVVESLLSGNDRQAQPPGYRSVKAGRRSTEPGDRFVPKCPHGSEQTAPPERLY